MECMVKVCIRYDRLPWSGRIKAIESGSCSGIFRTSVIYHRDYAEILYHTEAYRKISCFKNLGRYETLHLIRGLLKCLNICENKMFLPEEMVLSLNNIYCSEGFSDVKIAYIPCKKECSRKKSICHVIMEATRLCDDYGKEAVCYIVKQIEKNEYRSQTIMAILDELMGEASH